MRNGRTAALTTETLDGALEPDDAVDLTGFAPTSDAASRSYLLVSFLFLATSLVAGLVLAVQLVAPGFLAGVAALTYGRLQPAATHLFVYGWLTIGLAGAVLHVVPRVTRSELSSHGQARSALALLAVGYLAGAIAILAGYGEGRRLLEAPLWADAVVLLGLVGFARVITATLRGNGELGPVHWYAAAASWWLVLLHVAGNLPVWLWDEWVDWMLTPAVNFGETLTGVASALQVSFYRAGLTGLWVAAAGVGIVYYLIPRLTGREALVPTQMSVIGLWSLAFVWALAAPADMTYGPAPDWLDTIGVIFALGMLIPVAVIFADIVTAMRGRWGVVRNAAAMRYVMAGAVAFALLPLLYLLLAVRSTAAVVGFTGWFAGYEFVAFGAAGTFWLLAYSSVAASDLGRGRPALQEWQYRSAVLGALVVAASLLFGGVQAGLTWLGSANSNVFANAGDGFRNTVEPLQGLAVAELVGFALYAFALLWFVLGILGRGAPAAAAADADPASDDTAPPEIDPDLVLRRPLSLGRLLGTATLLLAFAFVLVVLLPSLEGEQSEPTILADRHRNYEVDGAAADGRAVYLQEGCQTCHTQVVRPIVSDVGLGAVSVAGDYAYETPVLIGHRRLGPDLMHVAGRSIDARAAELAGPEGDPSQYREEAGRDVARFLEAHLRDPRAARPWSTMPSYDHLSDSDLEKLVAYLLSLE
jgi:cbb3-type cytochrome oxidase subunit 1/cbb3-type cytochrome oxidase cytochrome c subunit